jgi:hypothetical protein
MRPLPEKGGLCGELARSVTTVPDEFFKDRQGGAGVEELESYEVTPQYGILVITK